MKDVLDKRLVYVTGKGGVGKTTVAAALGLAAARAGKRTMICEVAEQERITRAFGHEPAGFTETEVAESLHAFSIDPEKAKGEWVRHQLRSGALAGLLNQSRIFQYLTAAAPGLGEVVTMGKIWELAQLERRTAEAAPYDLVIVDAPATGHGLALLRAPRTFADIAQVGPIKNHAEAIHSFTADPAVTAVVAVALAEEMPVNETIDLEARLAEQMGLSLSAALVNGVLPARFTNAEAEA
nr:AAA family ATPase [Actinomycetota bacterium]